ncbi:FAD-dependent oxidoreductase [Gemmatimonas sp.]|uniref:FAD-dependent oxidoreductase n=1 Tax=Gemmatimonas sp. TaxID=1962908 RepID=UPI00333F2BE7
MSSSDEVDGWSAAWPTTLDWTFDFHKLLEGEVDGRPCIGTFEGTPPKVAIIGAGVAGLMTARELLRAGCETVHLYEATDRIGGRTWSIPAPGQRTCYEMGAMRIPFFHTGDDAVHETPRITTSSNCVLASLCKEYGIQTVDFPMPGGPGVVTGTYLNDGFGVSPNAVEPEMLVLKKRRENEGGALEKKKGSDSDAAIIQKIDRVWSDFASHFKAFAGEKYKMYAQRPEAWRTYWKSVVEHYHAKDFRDLVFAENITSRDTVDGVTGMFDAEQSRRRFELGDFGGLGLNNDLATVFYTVGAGDGGWGAFYDISSLYVIRILLAGYGSHQQLVVGLQHPPEIALSCDSDGRVLPTPPVSRYSILRGKFVLPADRPGTAINAPARNESYRWIPVVRV